MHLHILGICGTFMGSLALLARDLGHTKLNPTPYIEQVNTQLSMLLLNTGLYSTILAEISIIIID